MRAAAAVGVLLASTTAGHAAELKVFTSIRARKQALNETCADFRAEDPVTSSPSTMVWRRFRRSGSSDGAPRRCDHPDAGDDGGPGQAEQPRDGQHRERCPAPPSRSRLVPGRPKPDISTADAFKRRRRCCRPNRSPTPIRPGGGLERRWLQRKAIEALLGIAEQMKAQDHACASGAGSTGSGRRKAEGNSASAQASEIVPVAGAQLVGPLPESLAASTLFTGGGWRGNGIGGCGEER